MAKRCIHGALLACVAVLPAFIGPVSAQAPASSKLQGTAGLKLAPQSAESQIWASELAKVAQLNLLKGAVVYSVTLGDSHQTIMVSVLSAGGVGCDFGANDSDAVETPPVCPAKVAVIRNGKFGAIKSGGMVCFDDGERNDDATTYTTVQLSPDKKEISLQAFSHGKPEKIWVGTPKQKWGKCTATLAMPD